MQNEFLMDSNSDLIFGSAVSVMNLGSGTKDLRWGRITNKEQEDYQQSLPNQQLPMHIKVQLMDLAGAADGFLKASFHVEVAQLFMTREGTGATQLIKGENSEGI
ncbi:hypothetical protein C5167_044026 [Papaver somniferum]|uniref:Uncharacterized protein n=1 Tax=Papaver somniferum TaxID=3469 RepID=A0A4Y7LAY7_PAPSO|nr:hypothetical protein C5167_044026 [Papaver somniferum]